MNLFYVSKESKMKQQVMEAGYDTVEQARMPMYYQ